ncbi:MAG TPA: ubiquitin-like protein Pup [Acidimicrobiia bacterium]|nr:ubiquitin-like protein Pup [Acidimicrobiia bacterium]
MPSSTQSARVRPAPHREDTAPEPIAPATVSGGAEDLIDGTDGLLDEIDAVLEEQTALTRYRQRPGQ